MKIYASLIALTLTSSLYAGSYNLSCTGWGGDGNQTITFTRDNASLSFKSRDERYPRTLINLVTIKDDSLSVGSEFEFAFSHDDEESYAKITLTNIEEINSWEEGGEDCPGGYTPGASGASSRVSAKLVLKEGKEMTMSLSCTDMATYGGSCNFEE